MNTVISCVCFMLAFPEVAFLLLFEKLGVIKKIKFAEDRPDMWSFAHTLATLLICLIFDNLLVGWIIMFLYELICDGIFHLDKRGASAYDLGFNKLGMIIASIFLLPFWNAFFFITIMFALSLVSLILTLLLIKEEE